MIGTTMKTLAPVAIALAAVTAHGADYKVDKSHSKVGFTVKHMMFQDVSGNFKDFEGTFTFDPVKGTLGATNFVVKTASINTDDADRDKHLKGPDFFDVENKEKNGDVMTITDSKIKKTGKNTYNWDGYLTIKGTKGKKPVPFKLTQTGTGKDPWGNTRVGFKAVGEINRSDYGLTWNKALESGGVLVSDKVTINLDISAIEQKAEAPKTADAAKDATAEAAKKN